MLNMKVNNDALVNVEQIAQNETDVARPVPILRATAYITSKGDGSYGGAYAEIYPLPDGSLIRLPINGKREYVYEKATEFPADHHALLKAQQSQTYDPSRAVKIDLDDEGPCGKPARKADVDWLKSILEPQIRRQIEELRVKGLIR